MEAPAYSAAAVDVVRLPDGRSERDLVAVEEPLEIRIGGRPVAVTMRTPGHDEELALGFCLSEGLRPAGARAPDDLAANTVDVDAPGFDPERLQRSFYTTSSCGVCGKGALEAVAVDAPRVESQLRVPLELVESLPVLLRETQDAFAVTGGLHATGLFAADGELLCVREDVGRHNALDKVVGWAFGAGRLPLADSLLCVSGRLSFELVQKAAVAGCPVLVAVGAPSSLAVELAADRGITLCGFVRGGSANATPRRGGSRAERGAARRRREHALRLAESACAAGTEETLAERAWRVLGEACDERLAVGKTADGLELPFPLLDDGSDVRAALAGIVAGLRAAVHDVAVVLPVDVPYMTPAALHRLADACGDAAITQEGPLPCAYRKTALPALERGLAEGRLRLRDLLAELGTAVVELDPALLVNVNTPDDLRRLG